MMKKPSTIVRYAKPVPGPTPSGPEYERCFEEPPPYVAVKRDQFTEEEFRKSCKESCKDGSPNYGLLALAIGNWVARRNYPKNPPHWALEECRKLYEESQVAMRPIFSPSRGPASMPSDEQLLERVADLMTDPDLRPEDLKSGAAVSLRSAIIRALPEEGDNETNIRRLTRLFANDRDHRMERASVRYVEKLKGRRALSDNDK